MRLLTYFMRVTFICVGVLLLMVISDLINPQNEVKAVAAPSFTIQPEETLDEIRARRAEAEDVNGPWHHEQFENEVAFNLDIDSGKVTQEQFNQRYGTSQK